MCWMDLSPETRSPPLNVSPRRHAVYLSCGEHVGEEVPSALEPPVVTALSLGTAALDMALVPEHGTSWGRAMGRGYCQGCNQSGLMCRDPWCCRWCPGDLEELPCLRQRLMTVL